MNRLLQRNPMDKSIIEWPNLKKSDSVILIILSLNT